MEEQEINLMDLVEVLIRRKAIIFSVFIGVFLIFGIKTLLKKPYYESKVAVLITPSRLQVFLNQSKTGEIRPTFNLDTHVVFLKSTTVLNGIIAELKLNLTAAELLNSLKVEKSDNANVLNMLSRSDTPKMAQEIADVWAEKYIQLIEDTMARETKGTTDLIINQFNLTRSKLREAEAKLSRFNNASKLDLMKKNAEVLETKLFEAKKRILELKTEVQSKQTLIGELGAELSRQEKFTVVSKSIDDEALWNKIVQEGKQKEWLEKSKLKTEEVNPIYLDLERRLVFARTEQKVAVADKIYFEGLIGELQKQVDKLKETINNKNLEYVDLSRDVGDKQETYQALYTKNEEARIAEGIVLGEVRLISPAYLPTLPVTTRKKDLMLGAGLGMFLGIFLAFFREFIEKIKKR
ncbi:MAG: GNVR domain-containing protein [Elusimicrobiota bacterium]